MVDLKLCRPRRSRCSHSHETLLISFYLDDRGFVLVVDVLLAASSAVVNSYDHGVVLTPSSLPAASSALVFGPRGAFVHFGLRCVAANVSRGGRRGAPQGDDLGDCGELHSSDDADMIEGFS